tara:strand:+ start:180 stop:311 length:132 start_codon:yes stop_codon:yes gene_type:complete
MAVNNIKPEDLHAANTAAFLVSSLKPQAASVKLQAASDKLFYL